MGPLYEIEYMKQNTIFCPIFYGDRILIIGEMFEMIKISSALPDRSLGDIGNFCNITIFGLKFVLAKFLLSPKKFMGISLG